MKFLTVLLFATTALAQPMTLEGWTSAHEYDCNAAFEHFAPAQVWTVGDFTYSWTGGTIAVTRDGGGKVAKLGLLSGVKDADPETQLVVKKFLADFDKADVDAVIIGGDSAESPEGLDAVFAFLAAATQRPLLVIAGNSERAAAMNYSVSTVQKSGAKHLINMNQVRRFDGHGFDIVSVAGYYDKAFAHMTGVCMITDAHIDNAAAAAKASNDAVVLLAHGPPKFLGKKAIDFVPGVGNVGDERLTALLRDSKIPFGIFGHILEAAANANDLKGTVIAPGKKVGALYVNQGSANPLPWKMNDGTTSYGLAAILSIEGKSASYQVLRAPKPGAK